MDETLRAFVERIGPFPERTVSLVGIGPGDAGLISVRGAVRLRQADVVFFDVTYRSPGIWALMDDHVEQVFVGKGEDGSRPTSQQVVDQLRPHVTSGRNVVLIKGGDPFVFARGEVDARTLVAAGFEFEVVPAPTAAVAAASFAGVPLTERSSVDALCLAVGRSASEREAPHPDLPAMVKSGALAVYLGEENLPQVCDELLAGGLPGSTPVTIVERATRPNQRITTGTIDSITSQDISPGIEKPAVVFFGPQAAARDELRWFDRRPLAGQRVLVTRPWHQSAVLAGRLAVLGAEVIEAPTVAIEDLTDYTAVDNALRRLADYDWLIVTSANGVDALARRLQHLRLDARALAGLRIAAIGPATGDRLRNLFIEPDLIPEEFVAESLAQAAGATGLQGKRCLLLRSDIARQALPDLLAEAGATCDDIPIYRTTMPAVLPGAVIDDLRAQTVQWATFTSSSTFSNFTKLLGDEASAILRSLKLASIGPITSRTIRTAGWEPAVEAATYTVEGLAAAIAQHAAAR